MVFAPLRIRSAVPPTPAPDLVATSREKIREWALSHPWRRLTLSGWTLFPSETLPQRNLRALHSYRSSTRSYRKARRSKPFPMQTSDSGSTKQGFNFYLQLMWSRFGAFWEFDILGIVGTLRTGLFIWGDNMDLCFFILVA